MKIPFTIEDAKIALTLKMGRVVTKEGYAVEILDWNFKEGKYEHLKVRGKCVGLTACWDVDGKYYIHSEDSSIYINIHRLDLEIEIDDSP
jgi:hypothetical protein